jgi:hypothetical protein
MGQRQIRKGVRAPECPTNADDAAGINNSAEQKGPTIAPRMALEMVGLVSNAVIHFDGE